MPRHQCIPLTDANTNTINSHLGLYHLAIFFLFSSPRCFSNSKKWKKIKKKGFGSLALAVFYSAVIKSSWADRFIMHESNYKFI
jgi:hypothetical protein